MTHDGRRREPQKLESEATCPADRNDTVVTSGCCTFDQITELHASTSGCSQNAVFIVYEPKRILR